MKKSVVLLFIILREPRGSQSGREKCGNESFQTLAEEPLGTDSHRTISKQSSEYWLLIGHKKMHCIIVPNRRTDFREFVHDGYYLATVAQFIHQAFLTRQRNYRWVEKCFGCYQREQFNLHWENSVSDGSQCILNNRKFKMWRHRTRNKKQGKTTTLPVHHTLLYISLPSLQDYHVKMPSFTFCEGCKQAMSDKFSFS